MQILHSQAPTLSKHIPPQHPLCNSTSLAPPPLAQHFHGFNTSHRGNKIGSVFEEAGVAVLLCMFSPATPLPNADGGVET